jgi:hypothetical protein
MVTFPIDFFEHCQAMNEVEFGGNDLLQIYNTQQIKHRLNTTGNDTSLWKIVEVLRGTWGRMHEFYEIQCHNGRYYLGDVDL